MNIFRQSTCRWSRKLPGPRFAACGLALSRKRGHRTLATAIVLLVLFSAATAQVPSSKLPPFLKDFLVKEPATLTKEVKITSEVGPVAGYLARPDTQEKLPAILLIHDEDGLTDWMKLNAREISSIGYVVLAVDLRQRVSAKPQAENEERVLAELSAAVRWLKRRPDVFPDRIGVVGWSWGGGKALALASATRVQACVICDGPLAIEPGLPAGMRDTAVLGIFSAPDKGRAKELAGFRRALQDARIPNKIHVFSGTRVHFMGPPSRKDYIEAPAEQAWLE